MHPDQTLFDNLPELLTPKVAAKVSGYSIKTVYDWKYRPEDYSIPTHIEKILFQKNGRRGLRIRKKPLREWLGI